MAYIKKVMDINGNLHKCEYFIKHSMCLGCSLAEQNINADNCKYREQSGLDLCKKIIEGIQQKIWK